MKHGKVDENQAEIVDAFRRCGASVVSLADVGGGIPDLLIGYRDVTFLVEVKTAEGKLNDLQKKWHARWNGQIAIVRSVDDVLRLLGLIVVNQPASSRHYETVTIRRVY